MAADTSRGTRPASSTSLGGASLRQTWRPPACYSDRPMSDETSGGHANKPGSNPPPSPSVAAPTAVHHLAVKVRDLERAEAFYAGVLQLTITRRHDDERGRPRSIWFALGGATFLAVERAERGEPVRFDDAPGWHCIALAIPLSAREAWRQRLADKGFPVEHETAYTLY